MLLLNRITGRYVLGVIDLIIIYQKFANIQKGNQYQHSRRY